MNKIPVFITALTLMLSCFSCNDKKQDEDIPEESTVTVTEDITDTEENTDTPDTGNTVVETGFRELSNDDFKTINVALTYPDKEAPVTMTRYELPKYDYGERLSPCKLVEDPSVFDPDNFNGSSFDKKTSLYSKMVDQPEKGAVAKAFKSGDKIYMLVDYDRFCMYCHEFAVFCYDTVKKTTEEVYTYSDDEYATYMYFNTVLGDKLIISRMKQGKGHEISDEIIEAVDLENGTSEEIYHSGNPAVIASNGIDKLQINIVKQTESDYKSDIIEYNAETGEQREIAHDEPTNISAQGLFLSKISAFMRNTYDGGCQIVTDRYSLSTDIETTNFMTGESSDVRTAELIYASENRVIIQEYNMFFMTENLSANPNRKTLVHTYDLDKMEHYVTEVAGKLCNFASYNGDIIMCETETSSECTLYYVKPDLGLSFKIDDGLNLLDMSAYGNSLELNEYKNSSISVSKTNTYTYEEVAAVWIMGDKEE